MPKPTIRRLMLIIAFAALPLGIQATIEGRRKEFYRLAVRHLEATGLKTFPLTPQGHGFSPTRLEVWHFEMAAKYARASEQPWMPVAGDTPEPRDDSPRPTP